MNEKITCVIITKNEEKNIERCLLSVQDIADEIIVVDSYSTDKTEEICKKYCTSFIKREWEGYSKTKNHGNSLAAHPYILSLDADEALSDKLKDNILKLKAEGFAHDSYIMNRMTNYCGSWIKHCGWYPDRKIRLWRKKIGSWEGMIHEKLELANGTTQSFISGDILHYSYYNINEHINQIIHFTNLMAQNNFEKGQKPSLLNLVMSPLAKFISSYIIKRGILDGFHGLVICSLSSFATFVKYVKTIQWYRQYPKESKS